MNESKYTFRIERFNKCMHDAECYVQKGKNDPAYYVLAAMILSHLQYKESDCLLKDLAIKRRFDETVARLEL